MRELTSRQRDVLGSCRLRAEYGVPPTVRELGARFRMTPRAAFDHLRALERKGELRRRPSVGRTSRALTVVRSRNRAEVAGFPSWPHRGRRAPARRGAPGWRGADRPGPARTRRGLLRVARPGREHDRGPHLRRRPRGRARQDAAQPNDIVVAILGDGGEPEATVKRFVRDAIRIMLKPENPAMAPIVVDPGTRSWRSSAKWSEWSEASSADRRGRHPEGGHSMRLHAYRYPSPRRSIARRHVRPGHSSPGGLAPRLRSPRLRSKTRAVGVPFFAPNHSTSGEPRPRR